MTRLCFARIFAHGITMRAVILPVAAGVVVLGSIATATAAVARMAATTPASPASAPPAAPAAASSPTPASLASLSSKDAASGLRTALAQGIDKAVGRLGVPNGFDSDARFTIPLPPALAKSERVLRSLGLQKDADALKAAMNRSAELAVAEAKPVFRKALTSMTVADAKSIVAGGETAATDYFRRATSDELTTRFRPIVARATEQVQLAATYDRYAGHAAQLGLVRAEDAKLDDYVTRKALDALFTAVADEERAIRKDPLGQASSLLRKVFGGGR